LTAAFSNAVLGGLHGPTGHTGTNGATGSAGPTGGSDPFTPHSLGLPDWTRFLSSGSTNGGDATDTSPASFKVLISLAAESIVSDLLNMLKSVWGFGQNQSGLSASTFDPTSDATKSGIGQLDQSAKTALNSILKPHDHDHDPGWGNH
jgi:hypothetical protein